MAFPNIIKLKPCLIFLLLTGCNLCRVETTFDEDKKANVCSLKNYKILSDSTFLMMTWYKLELNLDTVDANTIMAKIFLTAHGEDLLFRQNSIVLFKITKKNQSIEEIKIKCTAPIIHKVIFDNTTTTHFTIAMTRAQILEIASAEKVDFTIETVDKPLQGLIDKEKLQPLREFVSTCLIKI